MERIALAVVGTFSTLASFLLSLSFVTVRVGSSASSLRGKSDQAGTFRSRGLRAGSRSALAVSERINGGGAIDTASGINADGMGTTGSAACLVLHPFSTVCHSAASASVLEVKPESCPNTFLSKDDQC